MPYDAWMRANAPTYLQDAYGQAWMGGIGATLDDYVSQYVSGVLAAFPDYAPSDALGVLGDEMQIDRGPTETDIAYAARLRAAWIYWKLAGTPCGLLTALYFAGFPGAVIVQQNGLGYSLSGNPVAGADPTPLLTVSTLSALDVALSPVAPATKTIPAGTPWWAIDSNTDFCSRFQILFPGPTFPGSFTTWGTATFTASDTAAVTWNNAFGDTTYHSQPGAPNISDGAGGVSVWLDSATKTTTGRTVYASAPFTGTVDVICWQSGVATPCADVHAGDLLRLQSVVKKWRPAKSTCLGVYVVAQGKFAGWPVGTMAQMLGVPSTIVSLAGPWS